MLEDLLLRPILTFLLKLLFDVEVRGVEHYHAAGDKVLICVNHQSFLDPLIVAVFVPQKPAFAINVFQADKWYFRWLDKVVKLYRLDPSKPMSMKRLMHDLKESAKVVIFPEGRITTSGGIMKIYEGTGRIVEKTGAVVLPVRIDGAEYSKVSRLPKKLRQRWFPRVRFTFLPPVRFPAGQEVSTRDIYDVMVNAAFQASNWQMTVLSAILEASRQQGGKHVIACDINRIDMNYRQLFTKAFVLGGKLKQRLAKQEHVGLMLPNSLAAVVTFTALHMQGKIPCMLNFSSGEAALLHACRIATVKTVLTSRAFVEKAKLEEIMAALSKQGAVIYLEDLRGEIGLKDKLEGLWKSFFPRSALRSVLAQTKPGEPAVVLYTSGSEGMPKGVALSHANILSNLQQVRARLDLTPSDIIFNALPVFHSFGLTVGMIMPVVAGMKTFLYPSPLHYRVVPELVYDIDATIMLGTDTFYNGYARYAHSYDFWNIRLAVAGAEKLRETTRRLFSDKFRMNILEGYGVTETSPVIAVNTPLEHKEGTVGRPLPSIECRLEKVEGMEQGGRLLVKAPNVMLGYLKGDQPGVIQPQGEWYDTGDIVTIDEEGFIAICGRAKRFAKIGGEMVSLQVVEDLARGVLPDVAHAALAMPDERKGEKVILFTESKELTREAMVHHAHATGASDLCLPRHIVPIDAIPRLGTGKIDYVTLSQRLVTLKLD